MSMKEYISIDGVNINNIDDIYRLFDRHNLYNNLKDCNTVYNINALIRLKTRFNEMTVRNKFTIGCHNSYNYVLTYLDQIYTNKDNITLFFKHLNCIYSYNIVISPNKLKSITSTIERINNALSISKLSEYDIDIANQLLNYYSINAKERLLNYFKYNKIFVYKDSS